jgi:nitrite reductase/ring-hydroxylating ferredoxin subunit
MGHEDQPLHTCVSAVATFVRVARTADVPTGRARVFWVEGRPVALVNDGGTYSALYGLCSHQQKPIDGGTVWRGILECPWHHFQYDVHTGANIYPQSVYPPDLPHLAAQLRPLETYPVRVHDGWIEVGMTDVPYP